MAIINRRNVHTFGFDEDALFTFSANERILNFAALRTEGDLANGIFAAADGVELLNLGRIETSGNGAQGVFALGDDIRVGNYGSILTRGGVFDPDEVPASGDELFGDAIDVFGDRARLENFGNIQTEGFGGSAMFAFGDEAVIRNFGVASGSGERTSVLATLGFGNNSVNFGTIEILDGFSQGMLVLGEESSGTNYGSINVRGGGVAEGMTTFGLGNTLLNYGEISVFGDPFGVGIIGGGGAGNRAVNYGNIEIRNLMAFGMGAAAPDGLGGLAIRLENAGLVATSAEYGVGILHGAPRFDDIPNPPHGGRLWAPTMEGVVVNSGEIRTGGDAAAGVLMASSGGRITNTGLIETYGGFANFGPMGPLAASGIVASGDGLQIINGRTGLIRTHDAASPAVLLNAVEGDAFAIPGSSHFINLGTVQAVSLAIVGGDEVETVVNKGVVRGAVSLGGGDDIYVAGRGGSLDGELFLGEGKDTLRIEDGSGRTWLSDLEEDDIIDLSAFQFANLDELRVASHASGSDLVIDLDRREQLILANVQAPDLSEANFIFG